MAQASGVALSASPLCCRSNVGSSSHQQYCSSPRAMPRSHFRIVCQHTDHGEPAPEVSRRSFALAGAVAAAGLGLLSGSEAQAAKRKPPPPSEKKPEEDKNISAYDARLLASARRKEALKANIEKAKASASKVAGSDAAELPTVKIN